MQKEIAEVLYPRQHKVKSLLIQQLDRLDATLFDDDRESEKMNGRIGEEADRTKALSKLAAKIIAANNLVMLAHKTSDEMLIGSKILPEILEK